jgi:hypothetical protein
LIALPATEAELSVKVTESVVAGTVIGGSKTVGGAGQNQPPSEDGQVADFTIASELIKYPYIYYKDEFHQFQLYYETIESGITDC